MTRCRTHFGQRAMERGIRSVPGDVLKEDLERAICRGDETVVERVMVWGGGMIYRFWVDEGIFYVLADLDDGTPITCFTHEMVRRKKYARKMQKRGHVQGHIDKQRMEP